VYPKEIESVLARHDAVLEAAVIGAPHSVYGEVPVAYVVTYPNAAVTADELLELCRRNLTKISSRSKSTSSMNCPRTPSARSTNRHCGS
jgi:long-chain acyl-CoA synthetase